MKLKKLVTGLFLLMSSTSLLNAQIHGLSVADLAEPPGKGVVHVMGSAIESENSSLLGGRLAYGITKRILLFTDIGNYKTQYASDEIMVSAGIRYSLPVDLPFDIAVRTTVIPYVASYEHYVELNLGLLVSRYLDSNKNWAVYGSAGTNYQQWNLELALDPVTAALLGQSTYTDEGDQNDIAYSIGVTFRLIGTARLFLEAAHVADTYGCAGVKFGF
ncbi:hypothetical protein ACFL67_02565 [candidate division KSB1 bacterium]